MEATKQIEELKALAYDLQTENQELNSKIKILEAKESKRIEEQTEKDKSKLSDSELKSLNKKLEENGDIRVIKYQDGKLELALYNDKFFPLYTAIETILESLFHSVEFFILSESKLTEIREKTEGLKAVVDLLHTEAENSFKKLDELNIENIIKEYGEITGIEAL